MLGGMVERVAPSWAGQVHLGQHGNRRGVWLGAGAGVALDQSLPRRRAVRTGELLGYESFEQRPDLGDEDVTLLRLGAILDDGLEKALGGDRGLAAKPGQVVIVKALIAIQAFREVADRFEFVLRLLGRATLGSLDLLRHLGGFRLALRREGMGLNDLATAGRGQDGDG